MQKEELIYLIFLGDILNLPIGVVPLFNRTKTISPITIEPGVQLISAVPKKPRSSWFRNFMDNAETVTFAARKGCKLNKSKSK